MPSLFDIAKSGVQSYRQALAVTGQNIANINTDGYKRREAGLTEVSSGQGGITQTLYHLKKQINYLLMMLKNSK